jgi:hypothetical protein
MKLAHDLSRDYSHSTATDGHSQENANELSDYSANEYEIAPSSEDGSLEQSLAESGGMPAAAAEQGQFIGGE